MLLGISLKFAFPPPPDIDYVLGLKDQKSERRTWRPLSERYDEFMAEQWALDAQEEADARAKADSKMKQPEALPEVEMRDPTPAATPTPVPAPEKTKEVLDAEAKAAIRREKKRISEQKRRARKAEEARAAKAREKEEKERIEEQRRAGLLSVNPDEQTENPPQTTFFAVETQEQLHRKFSSAAGTPSSTDQDFEVLGPSEWGGTPQL